VLEWNEADTIGKMLSMFCGSLMSKLVFANTADAYQGQLAAVWII
jgi:hypothetical protein